VIAVAARHRHDPFGARPTLALEPLEGPADFFTRAEQAGEPHGVFERERGALAGMRTCGMRGVADQERSSARPCRQGRHIERRGDRDLVHRRDDLRHRVMPAGVKRPQMPPQRALVHRAEGRGVDAVDRLRAPAHRAVIRLGGAEAIAEETALSERHGEPWRGARRVQDRSRHEAAETDQSGIEGHGAIGNHMATHRRMHTIGADQEVALGAGAIGKMRDDRLVGAVLDPHQPLFELDRDAVVLGFRQDRLVEGGAAHVDGRRAEPPFQVAVDGSERDARL